MDLGLFIKTVEEKKLKVENLIVIKEGGPIAGYSWVQALPRPVYSVSKSFTAIAAGLAIAEGKLSLKDRAAEFFPGLVSEVSHRLASLTLDHLLTMSRGHGRFSRPGTAARALAQTLSFDPGERFVYDNGSAFLASAMITRAVGQKVRDYLLDRLFRPLGIPDPVWKESPDGYTLGATGLELTTGDLAAFGQLLLQRGQWKGEQLVPASWIDESALPRISTKETKKKYYDLGYGRGFWSCPGGAYRADGKNGQFVIVFPRQEAAAAITSDEADTESILSAIWEYVF
jgi:CubicO group peptidase (beta-lactamase class C family)